jgi:hypothetical protein
MKAGRPHSGRLSERGGASWNSGRFRTALDFLMRETVDFLLAAGLSRASLAAELRREAHRIGSGRRPRRPRSARVIKHEHEHTVEIAGVVHDWHRQNQYTDKRSGEPLALQRRKLWLLVGQRFPRQGIAATLRWMEMNGIVHRRKDGLYVLSAGRVVLKEQRVAMERVAALVPQYLKTALRNARAPDWRSRDVDRDARVFFLPQKYVRLWRAVALERTQAFLEGLDDWLEDHACPDDDGPTVEAAVHSYCYTGEPRSLKRAATNIGRLEGE